ncbi:phage baseplate protein [Sphingobacterium spiritivorum]|uniref:phage baseplate protein n=1 Tax=Sphingobacterium spiritivorum TaxID=258 RepID=UPI003DA55488
MKKLQRLTGGYKRNMDYILTLQEELSGVQNSLFKSLAHDIVLSGCEVTDHQNGTVSIAPGVVYVSGEIARFLGAANISNNGKAIVLNPVPVQSDPDEFFDGTVKNTYKEVFAIVGDLSNLATQIVINNRELYSIKQYMHDVVQSYGQKGEIKDVYDFDGTFFQNLDSSGLGITPKWLGWALMNGNNGTPNASGRVRLTAGRIVDQGIEYIYNNGMMAGNVKHLLTSSEMPEHSHSYTDEYPGDDYQKWGDNADTRRFAKNQSKTKSTQSAGGGQPHNNMQPYITVYTMIKIS